MAHEAQKLIFRRFMNRLLESGLLVMAMALGIGATTAGIALVLESQASARRMLASPEYRELVVSSRASLDSMEEPVSPRSASNPVTLSLTDLEAADAIPEIFASYLRSDYELDFITADFLARFPQAGVAQGATGFPSIPDAADAQAPEGAAPGLPPGELPTDQAASATPPETTPMGQGSLATPADNSPTTDGPGRQGGQDFALTIQSALDDPEVIVATQDRISGYRVSEGIFAAWDLDAAFGSLFTKEDYASRSSNLILGSKAALSLLATDDPRRSDPASLIGKRLLSRQGYVTVIGILAETGIDRIDGSILAPFRTGVAAEGPGGAFRTFGSASNLRFAVTDPVDLAEAHAGLTSWFTETYGDGRVIISSPREEAEQTMARNTGIGFLVLFLAASGLFIAMVNVSNILMSRGLRMRKNTGILMALGAPRSGIMKLFALEALGINVLGALAGLAIAIPLSRAMQDGLGLNGSSWGPIILGTLVSLVISAIFTLLPAWQNSRILPAEAMRHV